jgi:hypothetical protein
MALEFYKSSERQGASSMALTLDVATVARRWTSADFERKPRSGDRSYEVSLAKVTAIGLAPCGSQL